MANLLRPVDAEFGVLGPLPHEATALRAGIEESCLRDQEVHPFVALTIL